MIKTVIIHGIITTKVPLLLHDKYILYHKHVVPVSDLGMQYYLQNVMIKRCAILQYLCPPVRPTYAVSDHGMGSLCSYSKTDLDGLNL